MTEIVIEPATVAQAGALLPLVSRFYEEENYPFYEAHARRALVGLLEEPSRGRVWIVTDQERVVGYFVMTLGWSLEYLGRDAFVDELYVLPEYRGRGLGKRALAVMDDACRELGVRALHLEVERGNERAHQLYRNLGFEDHERFLMTKRIAP
ncbi:MAG TPA: GNAT family N-acetyltransferase [Vicinamibacteria bacterium]|nr:GNAT family N-acetyltransferase [Vicinamibacteria bacterium]